MRVALHQEASEYLRGAAEALGVVRSVEELGGTSVNGGVRDLLRPDARYGVVDG